MISLGIVLLILGYVLGIGILQSLGLALLVIGEHGEFAWEDGSKVGT